MALWFETNDSKIVTPSPLQLIALLSPQREIAICSGQGFGKSSFAAVWLIDGMISEGGGDYIFAEPTYGMIERIAIPNFLDFVKNTEAEGDWLSKKHGIYENALGKVHFLSTDNPEHLQGTHAKRVVMDEAGQMPFIAYQMLKNRTNIYNGKILMLSNPYRKADPWLFTHVKARYDAGDPEVLYLTAPSIWNPAFDRSRFEKDKKTMRPEDFAFYYLGVYTKPEGIIFDYNREDVVKEIEYDKQSCFAGADFGTGDPTVLEIAFINSTGIHFVDEYYKQDADIGTHTKAFAELIKKYRISEIFYDPSALPYVREMDRQLKEMKINVEWTRGINDNRQGVEYVTKLFREKRITIHPRCYRMLDEDAAYIWTRSGEVPDKDDHTITARKYLCLGLRDKMARKKPEIKKVEEKKNWIDQHFQNILDTVYRKNKKNSKNWLDYF